MKTIEFNRVSTEDQRLSDLVEEITARLQAGETCDVDQYIGRYPEYADRLRGWIGTMTAMADLGHSLAGGTASRRTLGSQAEIRSPQSAIDTDSPQFREPAAGILGDFRILRELGRGGMGVVYEVEQISLGRRVALKVLPFAAMLDKQQLARFKNEARAAATLDHPNIVAIYSVGSERGVHYYAMQLIEGQSLAELIAEMKPGRPPSDTKTATPAVVQPNPAAGDTARAALPTVHTNGSAALSNMICHSSLPAYSSRDYYRTIARLGIQAAEALDHAHQNGILHRDIKPANLLLDDTGKLWITDFGLARIEADAGMTMTGDILGTLRYMSPEQVLTKRVVVDHRSDIYSLGVTLYELLTLRPAFTGDDRQELLRQIAFDEPRKLQHMNPRIPRDLETIILKAIEKNPGDRYSTGQKLADDLRRFVKDEPIRASRPTMVSRISKWGRRHRTLVLAAMVVLVATFVLLSMTTFLVTRANRGKTQALANAEDDFKLAHQAIDELLRQVAESALARSPELKDLRNELFTRAQTFYTQLIERHPDNATAYVRCALVETRLFQYDEALSDFNTAIVLSPNDAAAHRELADFLLKSQKSSMRKWNQAKFHAEEAVRLDGHDPRNLLVASDVYRLFGNDFRRRGQKERAQKFYDQAIDAANRAMQLDSSIPETHMMLACAYRDLRPAENAKALAECQVAIKVAPKSARAHQELALTYIAIGNGDLAIKSFARAEELDHYDVDIYMYRGDLLRKLGRHAEAVADYDKAIALAPFRTSLYKRRAEVHTSLGHHALAIADYKKLLELEPKQSATYVYLGDAFGAAGRFDDSVAAYRDAILIDNNPRAKNNLAWLLVTCPQTSLRDPQLALKLARQVLEKRPKDSADWNTLGVAEYRSGEYAAAIKSLEKSIELTKEPDASNEFFIAMAEWQLDHRDSARQWHAKGVEHMRGTKSNEPELDMFRKEAEALIATTEHKSTNTQTK